MDWKGLSESDSKINDPIAQISNLKRYEYDKGRYKTKKKDKGIGD